MDSSRTTGCDDSLLCEELAGAVKGIAFHELYEGDPPSRVIVESDNFALIPDIAPLVEGHCLLVPKEHYLSFGGTPKSLWAELQEFESSCVSLVGRTYSEPVILEHGSSSSMLNSACISHAHWHLIPGAEKVFDIFERDGLEGSILSAWSQLAGFHKHDRPYIYYKYQDKMYAYLTDNLSKRHQYLRVVTAELFDIPEPEWDWAFCIKPENLRNTVRRLKENVR